MNRIYSGYLIFALLGVLCCHPPQNLEKLSFHQQKVLFLGNSITQNGTYVSCLEYLLKSLHPDIELDFISIGLSSETISCLSEKDHPFPRPCLLERLDRALNHLLPDIVVASYGMNDGIYHPWNPTIQSAFEKGILVLQDKISKINAKLVLVTPPPFDTVPIQNKTVGLEAHDFGYASPYQNYDQTLAKFSAWLKKQSNPNTYVVDWHSILNEWIQEKRTNEPGYNISKDGIHPSGEGHWLMARVFLDQLGWLENVASLPDWYKLSNDPDFKKMDEVRSMRALSWRNYIGYTRGETVKSYKPKPIMILMGGQSNMVGSGDRNDLSDYEIITPSKYYNYAMNARLQQDTTQFGPELGLVHVLAKAFPDQPFLFVKYAIGGSSLLDWAPNYNIEKAMITGNPKFGNMFKTFIEKIDSIQSLFDAEIAALLWMQGERDARIPEAGKDYQINFTTFIDSIRSKINNPELPMIFGLVNPPKERYPSVQTVRNAQREVAKKPNIFLINTDTLPKLPDGVHYNSEGQWELGRLFGQEMINVIKNL